MNEYLEIEDKYKVHYRDLNHELTLFKRRIKNLRIDRIVR